LRDLYEGEPRARTARIKAIFDGFVASAPDAPPMFWRNDEGDIPVNVVLEAQRTDLVVIGRPVHMDAADALHSALFDTHCLVLVAPRNASAQRTVGRHIVVGWKPGAPARQAVEAALPWLKRAGKITVLWTEKAGAAPYDASAREFFAKLGIAVEIIRLERDRRSVGVQLLDEASRLGGDCLLIGAFHHGALWQAVLGGVTRDVLTHAEIPVFLMRAK
jgi:nucleotide-binding universal stress UspA family protein